LHRWNEHTNGHLSASIAELSKCCMEESVLFPERLVVCICMCFLGLKGHVCVRYFRNRRKVEDDGEHEYKNCDRKVDPLHVLEGLRVVGGL
jgi:hypothetical protein